MTLNRFLITLFLVHFAYFCVAQQTAREYIKFGQFKFEEEKYQEAVGYYDKAISMDPNYANAYFLRSEAYYQLGMIYSSMVDIDSALKFEPEKSTYRATFLVQRAFCQSALQKHELAQNDFLEALTIAPDNAEVNFAYSKYCFETGKVDMAYEHISTSIENDPENSDYYAMRAAISSRKFSVYPGNEAYFHILDDFNMALSFNKENHKIYELRSSFYRSMNEHEMALEDYNELISRQPHKQLAYTERGLIKLQQKNYVSAIDDFSESITLSPQNEENYRLRALCLHNVKQYGNAISDFTTSIELLRNEYLSSQPEKSVLNTLAETYIMRGSSFQALGKNLDACDDFSSAYTLGFNRAINYYRKYCAY